MNKNTTIFTNLVIHNPEKCSYTYAEFIDFKEIYKLAINNPELIYRIEITDDFSTLFNVENKILPNLLTAHTFNDYQKAKKFAENTNGTLIPNAIAWKVSLKLSTKEFITEEFNNYDDALKYYEWAKNCEKIKVKPIKHIFK